MSKRSSDIDDAPRQAARSLRRYLVTEQPKAYTSELHALFDDLNAAIESGLDGPAIVKRPRFDSSLRETYLMAQSAALLVFVHDVAEMSRRGRHGDVPTAVDALWAELGDLYEQFFVLDFDKAEP